MLQKIKKLEESLKYDKSRESILSQKYRMKASTSRTKKEEGQANMERQDLPPIFGDKTNLRKLHQLEKQYG